MAQRRRNPFEELEQLFDRMTRQFEQATGEIGSEWGFGSMSIDVKDHDDELVVTADLPGFEKEDIDVKLSESTLRIKAHREAAEETEDENYIRKERSQRSVSRSVTLPEPVKEDEVNARYKNGVLTVTLPKLHAAEESRSIDID